MTAKINTTMLSERIDQLEKEVLDLRAKVESQATAMKTMKKQKGEVEIRATGQDFKIADLEIKVAALTRRLQERDAADNGTVQGSAIGEEGAADPGEEESSTEQSGYTLRSFDRQVMDNYQRYRENLLAREGEGIDEGEAIATLSDN